MQENESGSSTEVGKSYLQPIISGLGDKAKEYGHTMKKNIGVQPICGLQRHSLEENPGCNRSLERNSPGGGC
jgi:hypothetical protein